MIEFCNIIIALFCIRVFVVDIPEFLNHFGYDRFLDSEYGSWKVKPFNCTTCLSIYTSIIMATLLANPIYLTIYFLNKIIRE